MVYIYKSKLHGIRIKFEKYMTFCIRHPRQYSPYNSNEKKHIFVLPHGQSTWHSPQKVGYYRAYINQYMVTVPNLLLPW